MKNVMRVLSLIALTGTALAAASNASFAAPRAHHSRQKPAISKPVATKRVAMKKHKKGHKKVVINLERGKGRKTRKISKTEKKPRAAGPIVSQN